MRFRTAGLDKLLTMDAWTGHEVPSLPGRPTPTRLYDSARRAVAPTTPGEHHGKVIPGTFKILVYGMN